MSTNNSTIINESWFLLSQLLGILLQAKLVTTFINNRTVICRHAIREELLFT